MKKLLLFLIAALFAATSSWAQTDFESFTLGTVNYQGTGGTIVTGLGYTIPNPYGSLWTVCDEWGFAKAPPAYDQEVKDDGTGNKVWRISNAVTNGSYSDHAYSPSSPLAAGETTAALYNDRGPNHTTPINPPLPRAYAATKYFNGGFKFKSATGAAQPGLTLTVSPAPRQGPVRMSYLRIDDNGVSGFNLIFYETLTGGEFPATGTTIANNLSYTDWHQINIYIEFVDGLNGDGSGNDIVTIMLNGEVIHTGTTWETYYASSGEWSATPVPIAVDALLYRLAGTAVAGNIGNGFYFDDVVCNNSPVPLPEPITTIVQSTSTVCGNYDFQLKVQDFTNVGAISLFLNYDITKLDYLSFDPNDAISDALLMEYDPGELTISYYSSTGVTLADDEVLLTLNFNLLPSNSGIPANFTWSTVAGECEYAGPAGEPVYTSTFNDLSWTIPVRPVKNLNTGLEYCKIQDAIDAIETLDGHTITVAAGTYPEDIVIDLPIDLRGPNYNNSPNDGGRAAEAIIVPADIWNLNSVPREDNFWAIVSFAADGIKMNGFKISGDNPLLDGYDYAGMDVEAGIGVYSEGDNIEFTNNIVENFTVMGFWAGGTQSTQYQNLVVDNNKIDKIHHVGAVGYGFGLYIQGTAGAITNNVVTNVRNGIQVQPYRVVKGVTTPELSVKNNSFSAYKTGIYFNYSEVGASAWNFELNNITVSTPPVTPGAPLTWTGMKVQTMYSTANGGTLKTNTIDGTGASIGSTWSSIYGMEYFGSNSNSDQIFFTNNIVSNVPVGFKHDASANIIFTGNNLTASQKAIIVGNAFNIDATGGNTFNGVASNSASLAQLFAIEDLIDHKIDNNALGFVLVKANNAYVTDIATATAINNDYTRIRNAVDYVSDNWTINLHGTFDWTETNAAASWALGNDGVSGNDDDYTILVPAGLEGVTFTAPIGLGDARITGPGDVAAVNLEGTLNFWLGNNKNWTISNMEIFDFDMAIGMFYVGTTDYNNTLITNNHIRIATDLNATVAPGETFQNIGIHFAFGSNQTISNNIIDIYGDGVSDGLNYSSSIGMQSNTSGGAVYEGLSITGNTINILNAQSANPQVIIGIWENGHAHNSNITVSGNQFLNLSGGNNPAVNLQRGYRVTSHSSASTTVTYSGNTVNGANLGFQWISGSDFSAQQPVVLTANTLTGNYSGILLQSKGQVLLTNNFITGNQYDGIQISDPGSLVTINNNDLSGNGTWALNNLSAVNLSATCNWYGTNTVAGVAAEINGPVTYIPWLIDGDDSGNPGFVPDGPCTGATDLYVNDLVSDNPTNDIYTTAIGDDANPGTVAAPFLTITKAVNTAVDGTKIWVDAGTFQEQVFIGKTVDVTGVDTTRTIIKAPVQSSMVPVTYATGFEPNSYAIVFAYGNGKTVNISKVTVDGDDGRSLDGYKGVYYYEASGLFTANKIINIHDYPAFNGNQRGRAFYGYCASPAVQSLTISNNNIYNYQKGGIYVRGNGSTATVTGNKVRGHNIPGVTADNGIVFMIGAAGSVTTNNVSNNIYGVHTLPRPVDGWDESSGILLYSSGLVNVSNNTLTRNEAALVTYDYDDLTFGPNTFVNNKTHVWVDVIGQINGSNSYDKTVLNPDQPLVVYGCIQYGIDWSDASDVLNASAGTFIENVLVHTPVIVNGAGMTSTIVMPSFVGANTGGGSLAPGSSNIFLVQANDVTIKNLMVEGNNPSLTSGVLSNGVDVDARNGIITDHNTGSWSNLIVDNVKIQNIYLRGFYSSTGGYFVIKNSTVINVEGDAQSLGIMNWAGTGLIQNNNVSQADICSNHSAGVIYEYNTVTNSGGGIHTDNNGSMGGTADILRYNNVSSGATNAYGIWVFASYLNTQVYENTVTGVSVGLCASGQQGGIPSFTANTISNNQYGVATTTSLFGWGSSNCTAVFTNNFIDNNTVEGIDCEAEIGYTNSTTVNNNHITGNTLGVATSGAGTQSLNMECNWWGSTDGDVIATIVPSTVDYIPWLSDGSDVGNPGFVQGGTCTGAPDFTGNYKYYNSGLTALTNINVELWSNGLTPAKVYPVTGTVTTDGSGNFTFTNVLPATYQIRSTTSKAVGGINSTDAAQVNYWGVTPSSIEIVRWLAGNVIEEPTPLYRVNSNDAQRIQNYFLTQGNPSPAFSHGPWSFWTVGDMILANPGPSGYPTVTIPAIGTTVSKNFYGMVTGDFNRSFTPSALKSVSESLTLNYGQTIETGAEAFELPLYAGMDMTVGAVSLILNIPSDVLQVNNVYLGSDANTPVLYDVTGDELRISWYASASLQLQAGQRLVTLVLQVVEPTAEPVYLSLATDPLNELADQNFEVFNAQLTVDIIKTTVLGMGENPMQNNILFSNYPNPFIGTTSFVYTIPTDGKVLIEVYDIVGNRVMEAVNETQSAGEYLLKLDRNNLRPGVYTATLKLENAGSVISRTIKIISK